LIVFSWPGFIEKAIELSIHEKTSGLDRVRGVSRGLLLPKTALARLKA